jgi:predicted nucleotidyltransferase
MSIHDLNNLAISNGIGLNQEELEFSYSFIKKNWMSILSNKGLFDIDKYKSKYSEENFNKIKILYKELLLKYGMYL